MTTETRDLEVFDHAQGVLARPGVRVTPTGLELPLGLEIDEWKEIGDSLSVVGGSLPWLIGDWLLYGERTIGEVYSQYAELTGYSKQALSNMQWVSSSVAPAQRRSELTWNHHMAVAKLSPDEQTQYLDEAVKRGLTTRELRAWIAPAKEEAAEGELMRPKDKVLGAIFDVRQFHISLFASLDKKEQTKQSPKARVFLDGLSALESERTKQITKDEPIEGEVIEGGRKKTGKKRASRKTAAEETDDSQDGVDTDPDDAFAALANADASAAEAEARIGSEPEDWTPGIDIDAEPVE